VLNLVCIPFAGGNRYSYRPLLDLMPTQINVVPLEFPGRGCRSSESLLTDMGAIVNDLYARISEHTKHGNYAIFGHSMGGIVAYLLARKIHDYGDRGPVHVFITGAPAPSAATRSDKRSHLLSKFEFIRFVNSLGGCQPGILDDEEMIDYLEPILRADCMAVETYKHGQSFLLNIPLTIITGQEEKFGSEDLFLWARESYKIDFITLPGNHFFIFSSAEELLEIINQKLSAYYGISEPKEDR
jgi:surfactin synthase thioesterase subunit